MFNVTNKNEVDQMTAEYFYLHMLKYRAQEHWQIVSIEQNKNKERAR
jgi:hypothetical protein